MTIISNEVAKRVIFERGLTLPTDKEYADPRMKEIAVKLAVLKEEENALLDEIKKMK